MGHTACSRIACLTGFLTLFGCLDGGTIDPSSLPQKAYDESAGFVAHEWGTFTSVVGSDGTLLPGLHHEEEDLPAFVADRVAQARTNPNLVIDPTSQKMETPVTYFYSPEPRRVSAKVSFPTGILTQFYPHVQNMKPSVLAIDGELVDRYTQATETIPLACQAFFLSHFANGSLDWGQVEVLGRTESPPLLPAPPQTTWGFSRNTAANPLRVTSPSGSEYEKFLFYRGLGNFPLPLVASVAADSQEATLVHRGSEAPLAGLFLMVVTEKGAGYRELGTLAPGQHISSELPKPTLSHGQFVREIKAKLAKSLILDGLYTDEAIAMVDTWERSYFLSLGTRLLYLLPQKETDRIIPLTLEPRPDQVHRTMVIRLELSTPFEESLLLGHLKGLASQNDTERRTAREAILRHGRFAEPHLTRALSLTQDAEQKQAGQVLLREIQKNRRWAPITAE